MDIRRPFRLLHLATMVAAVAVALWSHEGLPERVAIHFDFAGVADGFASRSTSAWLLAGAVVAATAILWGVASLARILPPSAINVPNRSYWLAPDRRQETVRFIGAWGHGFGAAVNVFLAWVAFLVGRANLQAPPHLDNGPMWVGLAVFVVAVGASVTALVARFARVPEP